MIRLVSKADYRRVIELYYLDLEVISKFATEKRWREYAVVIKLEKAREAIGIVKTINRTAHEWKWPVSAKRVHTGVEVIRYA